MCSTSRTMLATLVTCAVLSGCSGDFLAPEEPGISARTLAATGGTASPVVLTLRDSTLLVGDTVRALTQITGVPTSRRVNFTYTTSDKAVLTVNANGLVRARRVGKAVLSASSSLGKAAVLVVVTVPAVVDSAPTQPPAPSDSQAAPGLQGGGTQVPPFTAPILPTQSVDVRMPAVTGRTIRVPAGDASALQAALNSAVGGDEVVLPNGSQYTGNFKLPKHAGTAPVIVRSETVGVAAGTRVTPTTSSTFATISTPNNEGAITVVGASSDWRVVGIRVLLAPNAPDNYGIVRLGTGTETAASQFVRNIILDRVYVSAGTNGSTSRCVSFNGNALAVVNSWLADCHAQGRDTQGICGWTGAGPFLIENNHIEGAGQGVMFGGADPNIVNLTPSDITIRGNDIFKPLSWARGRWTVKAAFELKNAKRVLFEGNVIENHWADAQVGYAILIKGQNQDGGANWSTSQDVTIRHNVIKNVTSGINLLSRDLSNGTNSNEPIKRVLFRNNLFLNVGVDPISGAKGTLMQLMSDHEDVSVIQNTFVGAGANLAISFDGPAAKRMTLFNNVFSQSAYGVKGSGFAEGTSTLKNFAPVHVVEGNVFTARTASMYPTRNFFPTSISESIFVNAAGGDYSLRSTASFSANGGTVVGIDNSALSAAVRNTQIR